MSTFAKNLEKFAELQKQGLEPVRGFTIHAVDAFEKLARKNQALYGDVVDYAVAQARLAVEVVEPKELFERTIASNKDFAELLAGRVNEYVELGKELNDTSNNLFEEEIVKPAKEAAEAASKKAA